jgi:hypothetical protein
MNEGKEYKVMDETRRLHRKDPERVNPIRNWSTLYRTANSWNTEKSSEQPTTTEDTSHRRTSSDPVTDSVTLGYKVIEEHIRQGQRIAQQINNRSYNLKGANNEVRGLVERLVQDSTSLLSLWFNFMNSLAGNSDLFGDLSRAWKAEQSSTQQTTPNPKTVSPEEATTPTTTVTIEVLTHSPTQVTLNLSTQAEKLFLATPGLHAMSQEKPPLTEVTFIPGLEGNPAQLRIRIPDGHPADVYTGVLVDRNTGQPHGTLSVRIVS